VLWRVLIAVDGYGEHARAQEVTGYFLIVVDTPECIAVIHERKESESEDIQRLSEGLYMDWHAELVHSTY
jgi:hypothetical protein